MLARRRHLLIALIALAVVCGLGATAGSGAARPRAKRPTVIVRRTSYGIPHIWATSYAGLGEGYGYAFAQDDICTMADDYVTVDAQRSRYFGPSATYLQRGNGVRVKNIDSDFFFQQIIDARTVEKLLAKPPPNGPTAIVKSVVAGYVKGYNRYLTSVGGARGIPDSRCRGKVWVHPITTIEAFRRFYQLIELASGDVAISGIATAAPPIGGLLPQLSAARTGQLLAARLPRGGIGAIGSNAVAIGRAGSRDHKHGVLLGNPHFPWLGTERFYQAQATIPGKFNVEGAALFGVPAVLIGHTASMAWSHTVSTAFRFTPFQLTLVPGQPTSYLYDGRVEHMTSRRVTVQVRQANGSLTPVSRTLWSSRFGPIFTSLEGVPLPWTAVSAFALGDANADNLRVFNEFFAFDRAQSAPEMLRILRRYAAIPWVNTIVADRAGNALYADIGVVPNVSNAKAAACDTALGIVTFRLLGLPVLDGSRSACNWDTDPDSVEPGRFGPSHMPYLLRPDYVTNSNDSYWLSNPHEPLFGYARIIGDEQTPRSLRTRSGLIMTQARVDGSDGLGPPGFTVGDMQRMVFSDRSYAGVLTRDALVAMCRSFPGGMAPSNAGPVAVGNACDVLAHWDLHENRDSKGAILFRRFWDHADASPVGLLSVGAAPFAGSFDPQDPVHTPSQLNTANPLVQAALGDAIADLRGAHIPLDATPGQEYAVTRNGVRIPLHGGPGDPHGEFNALSTPFTAGKGFGEPVHGSSFVQAISWNDGPCPIGGTILTYSLSDNPQDPHYADQTKLWSRKRWVKDRFCMKDVLADTKSTVVLERR